MHTSSKRFRQAGERHRRLEPLAGGPRFDVIKYLGAVDHWHGVAEREGLGLERVQRGGRRCGVRMLSALTQFENSISQYCLR